VRVIGGDGALHLVRVIGGDGALHLVRVIGGDGALHLVRVIGGDGALHLIRLSPSAPCSHPTQTPHPNPNRTQVLYPGQHVDEQPADGSVSVSVRRE
jgi:hypothetical protein